MFDLCQSRLSSALRECFESQVLGEIGKDKTAEGRLSRRLDWFLLPEYHPGTSYGIWVSLFFAVNNTGSPSSSKEVLLNSMGEFQPQTNPKYQLASRLMRFFALFETPNHAVQLV